MRASQPALEHARLVGERVVVRPTSIADAEPAFAMLRGNDEILRWLVWDGPSDTEELVAAYSAWARHGSEGSNYLFAIEDRSTGALAGAIGPRFAGHPGRGDIGYWLAPAYWGGGRMSEAVQLVNWLAFRHLAADVMYGYVFVGNDGSRRVLEKCGYTLEHVATEMTVKNGVAIDEWYLAVTRPDWVAAFSGFAPVEADVRLRSD